MYLPSRKDFATEIEGWQTLFALSLSCHKYFATLNHVYRTANQCTDHLAHMGTEQDEDLIVAVDIPISLREFLIREGLNIRRVLD
ncbi:hypothetical protein RHGRI_012667 [Rhododendron griersonianum]|uniref:RNase H type-1 domain-containing protein n=1 Tax=Rhododendron griersonianum TaxID=479676 RepID=A0AAV6KT31_9ERIC|nr:hypothetical protein RHGRI_012667 [Rhododendron griersonianum]